MSSAGISEGHSYTDTDYCSCVWISTASIPPRRTLEKKCDRCKAKEKEITTEGIVAGTVSNKDIETVEMLNYAMNQPVPLWKLIDILKAFGVIDKEMETAEVLERISNSL